MAHQWQWQIEPHLYRVTYFDDLSLDDLNHTGEHLINLMTTSPHPLHFLYDVGQMKRVLPSLAEIAKRPISQQFYTHPHLGWIVYIGTAQNPLHQFIASALAQNHTARFRWTYSESHAREFILEIAPHLEMDYPLPQE